MRVETLSNGLRVCLLPQQHLRSATFGIWVKSGPVFETDENNGISHFIEHIVFKGSAERSAFAIARDMDRLGASVNAFTGKEYTHFYTRALGEHIEEAAEILLDMVLHPRLDDSDIETEKGVILEEIAMCEDDPGDICYELTEASLFADTPYAREILGTKDSVRSMEKAQFLSHMARCYTPDRMVIGVGGSFDEARMLDLITRYFEDMPAGEDPAYPTSLPAKQGIFLKRAKFEQTHLMLTFPGVGHRHEDLYALQVILFLLGTGSSSRLNQRIREQLGLVYSIDCWAGRFLPGGYLAVTLSLGADNQKTALEETCRIIRELPQTITEDELLIAKEKLISGLIMSRERPHSKLASFGHDLLLFDCSIDDEEIINGVRQVTPQQAKEIAQRYFRLENASLTAVGNVKNKAFYQSILQETGENT